MIITQTRQGRTFVGSMNAGTDVVRGLVEICVDNSVLCADFSATGYIRDPALKRYMASKSAFGPDVTQQGVLHAVALHGNVSLKERQTIVRVHVMGMLQDDDGHRVVSGELTSGDVISLEFVLRAADDIRLYRATDRRIGMDPWRHMDVGPGVSVEPGTFTPPDDGPLEAASVTDTGQHVEVQIGDALDHPTLGTCEVIDTDDDDRLSIRLESGRTVQIHRGLLDLEVGGKTPFGGRLLKVRIRRRR